MKQSEPEQNIKNVPKTGGKGMQSKMAAKVFLAPSAGEKVCGPCTSSALFFLGICPDGDSFGPALEYGDRNR